MRFGMFTTDNTRAEGPQGGLRRANRESFGLVDLGRVVIRRMRMSQISCGPSIERLQKPCINNVSLSQSFIICRFPHRRACFFLLRRLGNCSCVALTPASMQSKRNQRKGDRMPLLSSVPRFRRGCRKWLPATPQRAASAIAPALLYLLHPCSRPCRTPSGGSRRKLRYSARHTGLAAKPDDSG